MLIVRTKTSGSSRAVIVVVQVEFAGHEAFEETLGILHDLEQFNISIINSMHEAGDQRGFFQFVLRKLTDITLATTAHDFHTFVSRLVEIVTMTVVCEVDQKRRPI